MPRSDEAPRETVSVPEAARILGISRTLAYGAVRRGELPAVRIGRRLLVPRAALDRLLAANGSQGPDMPAKDPDGGAGT